MKTNRTKKTLIISAFPGCGKTYLYQNQGKLGFKHFGKDVVFSVCDSDSSRYEKHDGWERQYVDDMEERLGTVDFLLVAQQDEMLAELESRKIPFVIVAPNNAMWLPEEERRLIKQQWFGRFVLRNNSHIRDFNRWFTSLKEKYDDWTSVERLMEHNPVSLFLLKQDQYLSSIITDLYYKKEAHSFYTVQ